MVQAKTVFPADPDEVNYRPTRRFHKVRKGLSKQELNHQLLAFHNRVPQEEVLKMAQEGNKGNFRHGIFSNSFLTEEERQQFQAIISQLYQDFVFNKSSDFYQVEIVALYMLKLRRAMELEDYDSAEKLDRLLRAHLRELKTTKLTREGDKPAGPETSPAEWATALLEKARSLDMASQEKVAKPPKRKKSVKELREGE